LKFWHPFKDNLETNEYFDYISNKKENLQYFEDYLENAFDTHDEKLIIKYYELKNSFNKIKDIINKHRFYIKFYINFIIYLDYYYDGFYENILEISRNINTDIDLDKTIREFLSSQTEDEKAKKILQFYDLIYHNENSVRDKIISEYYYYKRTDAIKIIELQEEIAQTYKKEGDNIISGAQFLTYTSDIPLSYGEKAMVNLFATIYHPIAEYINDVKNKNNTFKNIKNFILLLDEADLGFHPQWKKKYIKILTSFLPKMFAAVPGFENVQIIFTTHDPLKLSDIPNSNVVYLKKDGDKTKVLGEDEKPKKSFGANITDLLADSFFIGDGLIGDFAKGKINEVINFLNVKDSKIKTKEDAKQIIEIIDEPYLKMKLLEMYYELYPKDYDIDKEKEQIRKRAIELGIIKE
jgi:hypothetical protein